MANRRYVLVTWTLLKLFWHWCLIFCSKDFDRSDAEACLDFVIKNDLVGFTNELVWQKLFSDARTKIVPNFWARLTSGPNDPSAGIQNFSEAIKALHSDIVNQQHHFFFLDQLSGNGHSQSFEIYKAHLSAILLSQIPAHFENSVNAFYTQAFKAFMVLEKRNCSYGKFTSSLLQNQTIINSGCTCFQMEMSLGMSWLIVQHVSKK